MRAGVNETLTACSRMQTLSLSNPQRVGMTSLRYCLLADRKFECHRQNSGQGSASALRHEIQRLVFRIGACRCYVRSLLRKSHVLSRGLPGASALHPRMPVARLYRPDHYTKSKHQAKFDLQTLKAKKVLQ